MTCKHNRCIKNVLCFCAALITIMQTAMTPVTAFAEETQQEQQPQSEQICEFQEEDLVFQEDITAAVQEETFAFPDKPEGALGDMGRLYIPALGINTALFLYGDSDAYNQSITDAEDAAVVFPKNCLWWQENYNDTTIADHKHQGFDRLYNAVPNYTKAYIYTQWSDVPAVYLCERVFTGHNTGSDITDENGNSVWRDGYDILMYTCNDSWHNITVTNWTRINGPEVF